MPVNRLKTLAMRRLYVLLVLTSFLSLAGCGGGGFG